MGSDVWQIRRISGQTAKGAVRVESQSGSLEELIDLADHEWRWRSGPPRELPVPDVLQLEVRKFDPPVENCNSPLAHGSCGHDKKSEAEEQDRWAKRSGWL